MARSFDAQKMGYESAGERATAAGSRKKRFLKGSVRCLALQAVIAFTGGGGPFAIDLGHGTKIVICIDVRIINETL